ncbi:MAG: biopolymer transporter ExbD [Pseudomonadota bacterium]
MRSGSHVSFGTDRAPRRPSLTAMIDVVFLLLIFFMLAARFGSEVVLPFGAGASSGAVWDGPPRLVEVGPAEVALNGRALDVGQLAAALAPLMETPRDPVVLRARDGASLQALLDVADALSSAKISTLVLVQ